MSNDNNPYGKGLGAGYAGGVQYDSPQSDKQTMEPQSSPGAVASGPEVSLASGSLGSGAGQAEPVLDVTTASFMNEVIEHSRNKPVLVDFWAPWCGPCKQLTPILEAANQKAGGKIRIVKMNIDDHPEIAGQMGIQSIPAVVAFVDGQPKDAFAGAKSAKEVDAFIEKVAGPSGPSPLEAALEQASVLMDEENWEQAALIFGEVLRQIPDNKDALAGYGLCALNTGNTEQAKQALASAGGIDGHQGLETLRAAIDLMEQAESVGDFAELTEAVTADPANHQARLDLAIALNGAGQREEAADQLLEVIAKDKAWNDEAAKKQLLQFFEAWGMTDPHTLAARRKLSSLLFS